MIFVTVSNTMDKKKLYFVKYTTENEFIKTKKNYTILALIS